MPLPCHVHMEEQGLVGIDDGSQAWRKTALSLLVAGRVLNANVLVNGYTGNQTLRVVHDDIGLDRLTANALLLEVYNVASTAMRCCSCDVGEAFLDLETVIRNLFLSVQATDVIRRIESDH